MNKSGSSVQLVGNNVTQVVTGALSFTCTGATSLDLATNSLSWTLSSGVNVNANMTVNVGGGSLLGGQALTVSAGTVTHGGGTVNASSLTVSGGPTTERVRGR